jgi:hypothetical protein
MKDWIDCKDKLPEVRGEYIVNIDGVVMELTYLKHRGLWVGHDGDVYMGVTHWMPLPEPPKQKKI